MIGRSKKALNFTNPVESFKSKATQNLDDSNPNPPNLLLLLPELIKDRTAILCSALPFSNSTLQFQIFNPKALSFLTPTMPSTAANR